MAILHLNLHYGSVRVSGLTREGIESNSGHLSIGKAVQASYHQGHLRYENSALIQCTSNAYISIVLSVIMI